MNLRTLASTSALALLFAGAIAGQANAQVFAPVDITILSNGDVTGVGTGSATGLTLTGTSTGLLTVGADQIDALTVVATDGSYSYSGSNDLFITGPSPFVGSYVDGGFSFSFMSSTSAPVTTTNGVVTFPFAAVPEPNSVAMLAGLAVAGSGFASRRLRRRSA